jgi:Fe-S-cluster containining protein
MDSLPGQRVGHGETFAFSCHKGLSCFNLCCRNLRLFLYPYDVLRLRRALKMSSGEFIDRHVELLWREGNAFPDTLLRMADNPERTCPFLSAKGCSVYPDRPDACRTFPLEVGFLFKEEDAPPEEVYFFRPPDFCEGKGEAKTWTPRDWAANQGALEYWRMNALWAALKGLFAGDPFGIEGPEGPKAKMAFMATYNPDAFRRFLFESTLPARYNLPLALLKELKKDDTELLRFGHAWVRHAVFGAPLVLSRPRR